MLQLQCSWTPWSIHFLMSFVIQTVACRMAVSFHHYSTLNHMVWYIILNIHIKLWPVITMQNSYQVLFHFAAVRLLVNQNWRECRLRFWWNWSQSMQESNVPFLVCDLMWNCNKLAWVSSLYGSRVRSIYLICSLFLKCIFCSITLFYKSRFRDTLRMCPNLNGCSYYPVPVSHQLVTLHRRQKSALSKCPAVFLLLEKDHFRLHLMVLTYLYKLIDGQFKCMWIVA